MKGEFGRRKGVSRLFHIILLIKRKLSEKDEEIQAGIQRTYCFMDSRTE